MRQLVVWMMFAATVRAGDDTKPRPKLSDAVRAIVDTARAAGPEVYADTVVKLVESGRVPERELQIELLEGAFQAAAGSVESAHWIAIPGTPPDTREMYRAKAGALGLDAVSLQARALRNLLTVDRAKARDLFSQAVHPTLDPRPCEDPLVADIAPYYGLAATVAQSTFNATEKESGAHLQFLIGILSAARSPGEVAAFAGSLGNVAFTPEQWNLMFSVVDRKLEAIQADYRSFAVSFNAMQAAVEQLAAMARANRLEDAAGALKDSFRKYVVVQMTAARCQPDIPTDAALLIGAEIERKVEKKGSIQPHAYFESAESRAVIEHVSRLTGGVTESEFSDVLNEFKAWTILGDDIDILHQKSTVLKALMQRRLTDVQGARVLALAQELLATSSAQRSHPAEWMFQKNEFAGYLTAFSSSGTSK
jgi:hypothetical protein